MHDDTELLRRYVESHSGDAFAELVSRHLGLVYSTALRRVGGDTQLAEDVAQVVFIDLARKAHALRNRASLAGWLYAGAQLASAEVVRRANSVAKPAKPSPAPWKRAFLPRIPRPIGARSDRCSTRH